jgi:hypothetical protein
MVSNYFGIERRKLQLPARFVERQIETTHRTAIDDVRARRGFAVKMRHADVARWTSPLHRRKVIRIESYTAAAVDSRTN